jgi:hypothetical protein
LNNSDNIPLDVILNWKRVSGAKFYILYLAKDLNFQSIVKTADSIENTQLQLSNLDFKTKYFWKVKAFYDKGESEWSDVWQFETVEELSVDNSELSGIKIIAFPNPFNRILNIHYVLPSDGLVNIALRNELGINVEKIFDGYQVRGSQTIHWQPVNLNSGVYFIEIKTNKVTFTDKIIYIK